MKSPRLRLLGHVLGLPIYLVNGERVRNDLEIEFTSGGHGYVYPTFIPRGEIWIDDAIAAKRPIDVMATTYHEAIERDLMKDGMSYDRAHGIASKLEVEFRRELAARRPARFDAILLTKKIKATCPHCA